MSFLEGLIYIVWRGLAIGVIISAPMGPVGILCVQRTLEKGRKPGLFTGIGAAISDLFYCLLTGFGLSLIEDFLKANQNLIQIVGSIVIAAFGVYLFKSNPSRNLKKPDTSRTSGKRDIIKGFLFTVSNPLIIFLIIGLFARFNFLLPEISLPQYIIGYLCIILGALGWWWLVSFFVNKVRAHFNLRSMWLINKVTGSIIMIFAIVGIVTAITNMASAARPGAIYINPARETAEWNHDRDSNFISLPVGDFTLKMRVDGLTDKRGSAIVLKSCGNGIGDDSERLEFNLIKDHDPYDELYPVVLAVKAVRAGKILEENSMRLDGTAGETVAVRLSVRDGNIAMQAGDREYVTLLEFPLPTWQPDSVGFVRRPGSGAEAGYISLEPAGVDATQLVSVNYDFSNADVRKSFFSRTTDPLEGYWEVYDRTLEDSKLRMGGNYRLAIAGTGKDYAMFYMAGAKKNPGKWRAGTVKGMLKTTAHKNVFEVDWIDPAGALIEGETKAQFTPPDMLTFNFIDHASTLRLRKVDAIISDDDLERTDM